MVCRKALDSGVSEPSPGDELCSSPGFCHGRRHPPTRIDFVQRGTRMGFPFFSKRRLPNRPRRHSAPFRPAVEALEERVVPAIRFTAATSAPAGVNLSSVAVADFNRDGHQDIVAVGNATNTIVTLLGNGDGTFQAAKSSP